uniref:DUF3778 domain-containing protein n=1 Tax=Oryza meridionalis TaxID=40149 RepID=A0A0E0EPJ8_9ORYZ
MKVTQLADTSVLVQVVNIFHGVSILRSGWHFFDGSLLLSSGRSLGGLDWRLWPLNNGALLLLLLDLSFKCFNTSSAIPGLLERQKFYRHHLINFVILASCSLESSFFLFQNNSIHAGFTIRVEQFLLLRFNGKLCGTSLLSPVTPTPKSTTQQLTFELCRFCGDSRRSLPVCQAVCMSSEAQGFSCRGDAAELCESDPLLKLGSTLLEIVSFHDLVSLCNVLGCIP